MRIDHQKIPAFFHLLISLCYIAVGICLFTDLFEGIGRNKRILLGVIVAGYGSYRCYKAYSRLRNRD